jgi:hypothetical protein
MNNNQTRIAQLTFNQTTTPHVTSGQANLFEVLVYAFAGISVFALIILLLSYFFEKKQTLESSGKRLNKSQVYQLINKLIDILQDNLYKKSFIPFILPSMIKIEDDQNLSFHLLKGMHSQFNKRYLRI